MARVFDDYLDDLIESAHNIVMTNDIFCQTSDQTLSMPLR